MCFIANKIIEVLAFEDVRITTRQGVGGYAYVETVFIVPALSELFAPFGRPMVAKSSKTRKKLLEFHLPIQKNTGWYNLRVAQNCHA